MHSASAAQLEEDPVSDRRLAIIRSSLDVAKDVGERP
jgi:hypothetical protein